ncbi:hypothetical protein BAXH7_01615 [Bacillus amyloliquefaciens XH7]|nr:hypothetical protein BAXH7_01615 [Bacillus amyloliquefaciens XH7]
MFAAAGDIKHHSEDFNMFILRHKKTAVQCGCFFKRTIERYILRP